MDKTNYIKRMEFCRHEALKRNGSSSEWWQAVEVYQHLIDCDKSHTARDKGNGFCQWEANGVEK